jgi:hypothetical protein
MNGLPKSDAGREGASTGHTRPARFARLSKPCNQMARTGTPLSDFFPVARRTVMHFKSMHLDPEFASFTYGDPTSPKARLRNLAPGDLLVFYAGLRGYRCDVPPGLYLIGYFEVAFAGFARDLNEEQIRACSDTSMCAMNQSFLNNETVWYWSKAAPAAVCRPSTIL